MRPDGDTTLVAAIAGTFALVTVLRFISDNEGDAIAVLYVIPIGLTAIRYGMRWGFLAAGLAFLVFVAWAAAEDPDIGAVGYLTRACAFAVAAGGLSWAAQRLWRAERRARGRELHDTIVQQLAIARYSAEAGQTAESVRAVDQALEAVQEMVSADLR